MSALQQYADHIGFVRLWERNRDSHIEVRLVSSDLKRLSVVIDLTLESLEGKPLTSLALVEKIAQSGFVRIDLEPILTALRDRFEVAIDPFESQDNTPHLLSFPCLYAFQDWLHTSPHIRVMLDGKSVAELNMFSMRCHMV